MPGKQIAIFGGSFNPPGKHHTAIAAHLQEHFDEIVVVPCGPRPDKPVANDVATVYRAAMVDMAFQRIPNTRVELFDLEACTFTRTHELEAMFAKEGEIWHIVGTDLLAGGAKRQSLIHRAWARGEELWNERRFAVITRPGYRARPGDLPPHHRLFEVRETGSSSEIRERILRRQPFQELVPDRVAPYIERHDLYRGVTPPRTTRLDLNAQKLLVVADERSAEAVEMARELPRSPPQDADLIVAIGGDGTMLRAIRDHWRWRLPFFGLNAGHIGFLLNQRPLSALRGRELIVQQLPLLWVEMESADGGRRSALAFNDAWVERATGQTAWLEVKVDEQERLAHLVADGALVATAAGSTSYASAMGAASLPLDTPALLLVGSNVLKPNSWKPAVLPIDATVELTTRDREKRPLLGFIDGVSQGRVYSMTARVSNIAAVELVFDPELNPAEKLARLQFPPPE